MTTLHRLFHALFFWLALQWASAFDLLHAPSHTFSSQWVRSHPLTGSFDESHNPCLNTTYSHSWTEIDLSTNSTRTYCELFNLSLSLNASLSISPSPAAVHLLLTNISFSLQLNTSTLHNAISTLLLDFGQCLSVTAKNATLRAPALYLFSASNVSLDSFSLISLDALAPNPAPKNPQSTGENGGGGGLGGQGGLGCLQTNVSALGGAPAGSPVESLPFLFAGAGSLAHPTNNKSLTGGGAGAGFLYIEALRLLFACTISVNGGDGKHDSLPVGGGAGGVITIRALEIVGSGNAAITANGGRSANGGGSGAGGRIYITGKQSNYNLQAFGGSMSNQPNCQMGGQGTVYLSYDVQLEQTEKTADSNRTGPLSADQFVDLRCIGPDGSDVAQMGATDFSNSSTVNQLTVTKCVLGATRVVELKTSLLVTNGIIKPSNTLNVPPTMNNLSISCPSIVLSSGSLIEGQSLSIVTSSFVSQARNDMLRFSTSLTLFADHDINVQGSMHALTSSYFPSLIVAATTPLSNQYLPPANTLSLLSLNGNISLQSTSSLIADVVEIVAKHPAANVFLQGNVLGTFSLVGPNCSAPIAQFATPNQTCVAPSVSYLNYSTWRPWTSVLISTPRLHVSTSNSQGLMGAVLVLCSDTVLLDSGSVVSAQFGCPSGLGEGSGSALSGKPGGGGGHSGNGGPGVSTTIDGGAGLVYDNNSIPLSVGSAGSPGSSGGEGGSGGGYLFLEALKSLTLASDSKLISDGSSGSGSGSGGGSGGSILIHCGSLHGDIASVRPSLGGVNASQVAYAAPALVSASGGLGAALAPAAGSGGGGGGGRLLILWSTPSSLPIDQHDAILFAVAGAHQSPNTSSGDNGLLQTSPECQPGFEGVLCAACRPGEYKRGYGPSMCSKCLPGWQAPSFNTSVCQPCLAGQYSINATMCISCPIGETSTLGSAVCSKCPVGHEANPIHTECRQCQEGAYKGEADIQCLSCQAGTKSAKLFDSCVPCGPLFDYAHYVSMLNSTCPYECEVGFLPPQCKTPFASMVDQLGGIGVFAACVVAALLVTFVPFLCCFVRSRRLQKEKERLEDVEEEDDLSELEEGSEAGLPGYDVTNTTDPIKSHMQLSSRNVSANIEFPLQLLGRNAADMKTLAQSSLHPRHFAHHLHREYFLGQNSWSSPLVFPLAPADVVIPLVYLDEYASFAQRLTEVAKWQTWEKWAHALLVVLCLPLAHRFLRKRRKQYIKRLWNSVLNDDHCMLRNAKSRALASSLLFGCSSDYSRAWIDVLANHQEEKLDVGVSKVGLPKLPMVLIACGTGTYHTPFYFDVTDAFNKAPVGYFGVNWNKLLRSINGHLRTLRPSSIFSRRHLQGVLDLLQMENHLGIGLGKHLPLHGVRVELGFVTDVSSFASCALPALVALSNDNHHDTLSSLNKPSTIKYLKPHPSIVHDRSPNSGDSSFKSSLSFSAPVASDSDDELSIMDRALGQDGRKKVEAYLNAKERIASEQKKLQSRHSISYASLPSTFEDHADVTITPHTSRSTLNHTAALNSLSKRTKSISESIQTVESPPKIIRVRSKTGIQSDSSSRLQTASLDADETTVLNLPYRCTLYTSYFDHASSARKNRTFVKQFSLPSFVEALLLRNFPVVANRTLLACMFLALLFARVGLSLLVLITNFQLVPAQFALTLAFYPFAPFLVPALGVVTLISSSVAICRAFACMVLLSIINDLELIFLGLAYSSGVTLGWMEGLVIPCLCLLLTLTLLLCAHLYAAHLEFLNDLVLARNSQPTTPGIGSRSNSFIVVDENYTSPTMKGRGSRIGSETLNSGLLAIQQSRVIAKKSRQNHPSPK